MLTSPVPSWGFQGNLKNMSHRWVKHLIVVTMQRESHLLVGHLWGPLLTITPRPRGNRDIIPAPQVRTASPAR